MNIECIEEKIFQRHKRMFLVTRCIKRSSKLDIHYARGLLLALLQRSKFIISAPVDCAVVISFVC